MNDTLSFPHRKLEACQLARQFVRLVQRSPIKDTTLRKHASDSARSCAIHTAEGAARFSLADKSRCHVIARSELCESVACYEVGNDLGACTDQDLGQVQALGKRLSDMLSRLVR